MRVTKLIAVLLAAAAFVQAPFAAAADKATLRLNWLFSGLNLPYYLGVTKGYYAAENIDLTILEGRGSGIAVQAVGAKSETFGTADAASIIAGVIKGVPIVTVMSTYGNAGWAVIARSDRGISKIKDIEGKTVAVTAGDALSQLFPDVVAINKLDASKVRLAYMDPTAKLAAVIAGKADALMAHMAGEGVRIRRAGVAVKIIPFSDVGVEQVGVSVMAHTDTVRDNPALVRRFVKATQSAWDDALRNPEGAIEAYAKTKPDVNRSLTLEELKMAADLIRVPETRDKPIGFGSPRGWESTLEIMKKYRDLKTDLPSTAFYVNRFISD